MEKSCDLATIPWNILRQMNVEMRWRYSRGVQQVGVWRNRGWQGMKKGDRQTKSWGVPKKNVKLIGNRKVTPVKPWTSLSRNMLWSTIHSLMTPNICHPYPPLLNPPLLSAENGSPRTFRSGTGNTVQTTILTNPFRLPIYFFSPCHPLFLHTLTCVNNVTESRHSLV